MLLREVGLKATFLGSAQDDPQTLRRVSSGEFQVVYLTPEFLSAHATVLSQLHASVGLSLVAIDEVEGKKTKRKEEK